MNKDKMIDLIMQKIGTQDASIRTALEALYSIGKLDGSNELLEIALGVKK